MELLQKVELIDRIAQVYDKSVSCAAPDSDGNMLLEVAYRPRDRQGHGRLFASGISIVMPDIELPGGVSRTDGGPWKRHRAETIQSMPGQLRRTLCGSFLHDVDCSNSEVRNVCCLARRAGFADCIPTLMDYRDRRDYWLYIISKAHGVATDAAKRVVTLIMSGGRYSTWLRDFSGNGKPLPEVLPFATKITIEVAFLSRVLPRHADFSWTVAEREFLVQENAAKKRTLGLSGLEQQLLNRIIQWAEAQVLGIMHETFHRLGWQVRAKVFDGLMCEKGTRRRDGSLYFSDIHTVSAPPSLSAVMREAEAACRLQGWDPVLVEKPFYGKSDDPIEAIKQARRLL